MHMVRDVETWLVQVTNRKSHGFAWFDIPLHAMCCSGCRWKPQYEAILA